MARKIWFQLLDDESHHAFAGIAAASVIASNDVKDIEDFRNKVHAKFDRTQSRGSATLAHVASNRLKIYADIEAYDAKEKPLEEDVPIGTFGSSKKNALIVLVPTKRQMQIFWSEPKPSVPDVKRQRSEKLDSRELDMLAALVPQLENGVERMVGKILDIPTRSLNISVPYGLYIRQEYWDLYVIIKQQLRTNRLLRRFLVLGTSGVGKSVFGVFLLLVFLTERKNVAYRGRDDKLIYFTWDIFGYKCSQTPYAGCNYDGLFDGKGTGEALQLRKFNCAFLFADSCPQSYNEFAKTLCFEAYMEPWTKIECDMFADAINLNGKDDWLRTVNLVGGKPSVMVQSRHESEYLVHHVEASTPKNLEDDKYEVQPRKQNRIDNWTDSDSFYLYRNENAQL
ncbi:putative SANT/Myb domain-containing protein [Plasmopara halstedii]